MADAGLDPQTRYRDILVVLVQFEAGLKHLGEPARRLNSTLRGTTCVPGVRLRELKGNSYLSLTP